MMACHGTMTVPMKCSQGVRVLSIAPNTRA
jgi:hypothetical protein